MSGTPKSTPKDDSRRWTFYFDGECGMCCWLVRWVRRMDPWQSIRWVPFQSLELPPEGLSWDDLDRAAYLDAGNGKLLPGFYAIRKLSLKLPLFWPLAFILWLPGIQIPGRLVYRWIADNRYRLSRCGFSGRVSRGGRG